MSDEKVELRPILAPDVSAVAGFLHAELNSRVSVAAWRRLLEPPWHADAPNRGFQLIADAQVVGVYAAVYSEREIDGAVRRFCNLAAFCVLDDHRAHSIRLMRAILGQKGYEFTDLSPSGNVIALNARLGFAPLETTTTLALNLPALPRRGLTVSGDPGFVRTTLRGADAVVHRDHAEAPAARHVVAASGDEYAYLVFRRDRRRGVPIFATPLYSGGSRTLLRAAWPQVSAHLLRHGLVATLAEERILGFVPTPGRRLGSPRVKMFRSKSVPPERIDYLYSELTLLEW